jgi:hypothetical protein
MKHIHHIIPKYLGGSDDPNNLIELSIEEHAEAHRILYEQYGNIQDYCAWQGLIGVLSNEDIIQILCSEGGLKGGSVGGKLGIETHKRNKTGLFREDKLIQKLGSAAGSHLGGSAGSKTQIKQGIGIFGYSQEEKSAIAKLGGIAGGKKSGSKLKKDQRGIFDPDKRKEFCSLGGKAQKGFKKHFHENGDFKMALPGTEKSQDLINKGYYLKL